MASQSSQSGATGRDTESLEQIILDAGHTPGDGIGRFVDFASDLQRRRQTIGASDSDGITRSVALYALIELDPDIGQVLRDDGINMNEFATLLSLLGPPA